MRPTETYIDGKTKFFDLNIGETLQYKDLIILYVKKNFSLIYKQTVLGPLWLILQPLASSIVYAVVFGTALGISTDGLPQILFYLSGTALWGMFSSNLINISTTFRSNAYIFSKIYFPRLCLPLSQGISGIVNFAIQFMLVLVFYAYFAINGYSFSVGWAILLLPILIIQLALLSMGVGILISSLTIKYRDLALATNLIVQLWMYATPIVYPLSQMHGTLYTILLINPVTPIVNNFRYCLFGYGSFLLAPWILSLVLTVLILIFGIALFNRTEKSFVDVI